SLVSRYLAGFPWRRPSSLMQRGLLLGLLLLLLAAMTRGTDFALVAPATAGGAEFAYNKDFMSGILQAFMSPKGVNTTRLLEAFNPTPCLQKCMPTLSQFLNSFDARHSLRDTKDTVALCRQLETVEECATTSNCDSTLLDLITKMYKFACIDKIESLGDSLKCAQEAFTGSRAECETGCIMEKQQHSLLVDPATLPVDVASLCESSVCLLGCMQKSINSMCVSRGNTPSLFNAILTTSSSSDDQTLSSLLSGMLPTQCRDVLKAQASLPERIAQLAAIGKDSAPLSVGRPKAFPTTPSTTVTPPPPPTTVRPQPTVASSSSWAVAPVEAPIDIDGEARTLQYRVLDWERRPVASPTIERLARLIAQQYLEFGGMQMRADFGDARDDSSSSDVDWAFRRWESSHDPESYRALGFGVPTRGEGVPIPEMRANSEDQLSSYPSWSNLALAGLFPFVIYLVD
ncbi:hypothetical protein PENTCL1PPCAC_1501, partial [Pristionchus entomophagus]